MLKIVSIPLFQVGILFIASSVIWFLVTNESLEFKKRVFSFITDGLYYFILTTLGLNMLFNLSEVLKEPYRAILFSSESSWVALMLVSLYLAHRETRKKRTVSLGYEKYVDHIVNFWLLLGLTNHFFYYYKYRSLNSVLFILIYFMFYLFKDKVKISRRNEWALVFLALLHGVVMYRLSKIIIYYQIVFYPYQIISLLLLASILVFYVRRKFSSKQK